MSLLKNKTFIILFVLFIGFSVRFFPFVNSVLKIPAPILTPDPHYHARRVLVTINHFPGLPVFDNYISYPSGGYCIWPPLFDFISAVLSYVLFLGHPAMKQVEWSCAIYPIIYGILIILLVYLICKKLFNEKFAFLSALITAVLPGTVYWSRLGYNDHHIAESLAILLILYFLVSKGTKKFFDWIILGLIFGTGLLLWQGSILFVGIAFFLLLFTKEFDSAISFFIGFLIILPFSVDTHFPDSPFSYRGLSLLHLSLFSFAFLVMLIGFLTRRKSYLVFLPVLALVVLGYFVLQEKSFLGGVFFLIKKDPWLAAIMEFQPLMIQHGFIETVSTNHLYGRAYYVWPLMMFIVLLENRNKQFLIYTVFSVFAGIMAFLGRRYTVWFVPLYSIILVYTLFRGYGLLEKIIKSSVIAYIFVAGILLVIFQPAFWKGFQAGAGSVTGEELAAYYWLRDSTPQTSYFFEPWRRPEYGVMCFWGDGHQILYYAKRPVAASNFGNDAPNFSRINQFFIAESESLANQILDVSNCRYIYLKGWIFLIRWAAAYLNIDPEEYLKFYPTKDASGLISTIMTPNDRGYSTVTSRLQYFNGSGAYFNGRYYPPYRHYRLRFVSRGGTIKIYEYVKGAMIIGKIKPNIPVKITKDVNVSNYSFEYSDSLNADMRGVFSTVVPYPSDRANPYNINVPGRGEGIIVSEKSIFEGDTIEIKP